MEMDYFSRLNYCVQFSQSQRLPASARLTLFALLYKWNAFRRPTSFALSDRDLSSLTGLSIGRPITQAKRCLKNHGLIDFKSDRAGTRYFFTEIGVSQQNRGSVARPSVNMSHGGLVSDTPKESTERRREREKGAHDGAENLRF